tara:strand:- start:414 stop:698 length:285 start_codon:yes stop_codon:yes gene_type:complete
MSNGLVRRGVDLNTITNSDKVFTDYVSISITADGGNLTINSGYLDSGGTFVSVSSMTLLDGLSMNVNATNGSVLNSIKVTSGSASISGYVVAMK